MTTPSSLKCNVPLPSITAQPLVFPSTSLVSLCKSDHSLLPSLKFSPILNHWTLFMLTHHPLALIIISTQIIPNLYLHVKYCFWASDSYDLPIWTSLPGYPTNTLNSLSFPLPPPPLINVSSWILYLHDWFHHTPGGLKQKPRSYPSTPAFLSILTY